ncbi:MAG: hypothetical protein HY043_22885 [Verrucomicrobia bacterium]|nr:hypothetical protein [Verrucomicrobiota bacterium]
MSTLAEIETAVNALPSPQQEELFRRLPLVPATGHSITQEEIDDALDSD